MKIIKNKRKVNKSKSNNKVKIVKKNIVNSKKLGSSNGETNVDKVKVMKKVNKIKKRYNSNKVKESNTFGKIMLGLCVMLFWCLILFGYQVFSCYQYKLENIRLNELMEKYKNLQTQIASYEELKNSYMEVLDEESSLSDTSNSLQIKVDGLNLEIAELHTKIADINKKIKSIS